MLPFAQPGSPTGIRLNSFLTARLDHWLLGHRRAGAPPTRKPADDFFVAAHSSIRLNFSQNKPDPRSEMRSNVLWKRRKIQRTNFDLLL
jgi:hypothetical protein